MMQFEIQLQHLTLQKRVMTFLGICLMSIVAKEFFMFMKKITKQLPMLHFQNSAIEMPMIQQ